MALSNAERQRRFRERLKERAASSGSAPINLYAMAAELPEEDVEVDGEWTGMENPRRAALGELAEMQRVAVDLYETFGAVGHARGAATVAAVFALRTDLAAMTHGTVLDALAAAKLSKTELRKLVGQTRADDFARAWPQWRDEPIRLRTVYSLRPLLERLGLW